MKISDVLHCSFENWYPSFKKITPESIIIPCPDGFVDYLLADGIILPESGELLKVDVNSDDGSDDETEWDDDDTTVPQAPKFEEFDCKIKESIQELGGRVFPKLNWSSAQDVSWMGLNNSCCCTSVSEIYLLLKSSSVIAHHDLTGAFLYCEDHLQEKNVAENAKHSQSKAAVPYCLVLRKWVEIDPSTEFRCFVKNYSLIAISQREHSLYFGHIGQQKKEILKDVISFFKEHIQYKFPCGNYVFDVCREKKDNVFLVDFNPFGETTHPLLFEWSELNDIKVETEDDNLPELRYVVDNHGVQPKLFCQHSLPIDIVDISSGMDSFKLIDLLKMKMREESNGDSSDDGES